jgi:hypothetical protein
MFLRIIASLLSEQVRSFLFVPLHHFSLVTLPILGIIPQMVVQEEHFPFPLSTFSSPIYSFQSPPTLTSTSASVSSLSYLTHFSA